MFRKLLLAVAFLVAVAGAARAEGRLFTLATGGPMQTAQAEENRPQTVMGIDTMTFATVTIGAMFGAAVGTELAVIPLAVYGYPVATLWVAGVTAFVGGAVGGGAAANWILDYARAPRTSVLDRTPNGAAQAANRR